MIASSGNPPWRAERPTAALVLAAVAMLALIATWAAVYHGFYARKQITDLPVYERYGDEITDGSMPYRDFAVEYPPAALPVFVLPALGNRGDADAYRRVFAALMWICGALVLLLVALALRALRAPPQRIVLALAFVVAAPLLLGSLVRLRFDLWPAALTAGAVAALVAGRRILGGAMLGIAVAAKLYPAVLVPIALVYAWRDGGARAARAVGVAFVSVLVVAFLPFFVLSPGGVADSIWRQASRPLQIESLGASILLVAHHVFGFDLTMRSSHGSQNLVGAAPHGVAAAQTALQALALVALWIAFACRPADSERFVRYAAAVVCAFVAFGKVLSPQFMIWLVPLVPLVRGRRGAGAAAALGVLLLVTQLWFPYHYWHLALHFGVRESWLVFARDLGLVALLVLLVYPTRTRTASHAVARPS